MSTTTLRTQLIFTTFLAFAISLTAQADHDASAALDKSGLCPSNDPNPMAESRCLKSASMHTDMKINRVMHKARLHLLSTQKDKGSYQDLADLDTAHFKFLESRKQRCHQSAKTAQAGYPQLITLQRCLIDLTNQRIDTLSHSFPI